ncbi:hypothetical protein ACE6ZO_004115 [Salmonella enterica]|nr:hypothetical protein [Salmonella enterica]EHC5972854.1 hypothetical protein [Salmonella enterica]EIU9581817.1 hypothetical protein [Salmonella enterica]ELC1719961.1 hypothetical protein [Salmonella enterica]
MSERPFITLKRSPAAAPRARRVLRNLPGYAPRKTVVVAAAPEPRKQKKRAQKEVEKAAEAERKAAAKEERRRQLLLKNARPVKQPKAPFVFRARYV